MLRKSKLKQSNSQLHSLHKRKLPINTTLTIYLNLLSNHQPMLRSQVSQLMVASLSNRWVNGLPWEEEIWLKLSNWINSCMIKVRKNALLRTKQDVPINSAISHTEDGQDKVTSKAQRSLSLQFSENHQLVSCLPKELSPLLHFKSKSQS